LQDLIKANIHANPDIKARYLKREDNLVPQHLEEFINQDRTFYRGNKKIKRAIQDNDPSTLLSLLMQGYLFNDRSTGIPGDEKYSFLGYAARHGHVLTAKILVVFGGAILTQTAQNYGFQTAYDIAVERGHHEIADFLRSTKYNQHLLFREYLSTKEEGPEALTAFFEAAEQQQAELFESIIEDVEALDQTTLHPGHTL